MVCVECGSEMRLTDEPMEDEYRGERFVVSGIERWQCDECGDSVMSAAMATRLSRSLSDAYARKHGLLAPDAIRSLRQSLGMTQREFERLLGVSTPTCSRWENGAMQQSQTADRLMRALRDVPGVRECLEGESSERGVVVRFTAQRERESVGTSLEMAREG